MKKKKTYTFLKKKTYTFLKKKNLHFFEKINLHFFEKINLHFFEEISVGHELELLEQQVNPRPDVEPLVLDEAVLQQLDVPGLDGTHQINELLQVVLVQQRPLGDVALRQ